MFKGVCCYAGVKSLMSKKGEPFRLLRLIDRETGEFCELFLSDGISVPAGLKLFDDVAVELGYSNRQFRVASVEVA